MFFFIGLLTVIMVLDCLILILLVLIQLPKKEAGAGLAFGGSATDALFGAGSGTVLTKITKYAATGFFVLAVALSLLQRTYHGRAGSEFMKNISSSAPAPAIPTAPPSGTPSTVTSNLSPAQAVPNISVTPPAQTTGAPSVVVPPGSPATNPAASPATK